MAITALNRKLLRDLMAMRGQAIAIALVVAAGVSLYVTYLANFDSLRRAQQSYYRQQRFADVFATLTRAPLTLGAELASIPGVAVVEPRVVAQVSIQVAGLDQPAVGRLVSIPADRRPSLNDLVVRRGQWIDPDRPDEVIASENFVTANRLGPGDRIDAIINGRRRALTICGVALSPEYIYNTGPGELVPDDRRFGVFWMNQHAIAAAFDMEGGFNDVAIGVDRNASVDAVIGSVDALLARYGGRGAIPRALQYSDWTVQNELFQLESVGLLLPAIFLTVSAFVLNVALTRALSLQRPQIAALKALGYSNASLAWHYVKWALVVGTLGLVLGIIGGVWMGAQISGVYNRYFRFPDLEFVVPAWRVLIACAIALGAAAAGAFSAVRNAVRIPPAEAMRPEPPGRFRFALIEARVIAGQLGVIGRMVARNLARRPFRAAASVAGIAAAVALLMVGRVMFDAMDRLITTQFSVAQRHDAAVTFVEPRSAHARFELASLTGVLAVEPTRMVAARISSLHRSRQVALVGIDPEARLQRIVDADGRSITVPPEGAVLSRTLADVLRVSAGGRISIVALEGARRERDVMVAALVDDVLGLSVYMHRDALHRLLREGGTTSGALLLLDAAREPALLRELKQRPSVAAVSLKRTVLHSFRETMAANLNVTIVINLIFAGIIAAGVVYNAARVALSERSHELASLRVLGYTRAEISLILLSELAVLTVAAQPLGWMLGYGLALLIFQTVQTEVYRFPLYVSAQATAQASAGVIAATIAAALVVRRRLDRLDLVAVLKVRE